VLYHYAALKHSWPMTNKGITVLPATHIQATLPLLPSCKVPPYFVWYSLRLPTKGWPGWVDLGGWLHTKINILHWELNTDMVTHPSTNGARHRLTSLIETNMIPLQPLDRKSGQAHHCVHNTLVNTCTVHAKLSYFTVHDKISLLPLVSYLWIGCQTLTE